MDWNKAVVIASQCVVVVVLGGLVACGKDSAITDGLLAVSGSLVGTSLYSQVKVLKANKPPYRSTDDAN